MKRFLAQFCVATLLMALLSGLSIAAFADPLWGSTILRTKRDELRRTGATDVIFLGDSRAYFHIDPAEFDATLLRSGHVLRSFNAAELGGQQLEFLFVVESLLADENMRPSFIFVPVIEMQNMPKSYDQSPQHLYWMTGRNALAGITKAAEDIIIRRKAFFASFGKKAGREPADMHSEKSNVEPPNRKQWVNGVLKRMTTMRQYSEAYLKRMFAIHVHSRPLKEPEDPRFLGTEKNGYLSPMRQTMFDWPFSFAKTYLDDPSLYLEEREDILFAYDRPCESAPEIHRHLLLKEAAYAKSKGVRLFYYLPMTNRSLEARCVHESLSSSDVISVPDPHSMTELYDRTSFLWPSHLNEKAAEKYTRWLAIRFAEILNATHPLGIEI